MDHTLQSDGAHPNLSRRLFWLGRDRCLLEYTRKVHYHVRFEIQSYDGQIKRLRRENTVQNLRPLLPSKYQFHINGPIIFVCTRIGDIGSALFSATKDVDEQDVTFQRRKRMR